MEGGKTQWATTPHKELQRPKECGQEEEIVFPTADLTNWLSSTKCSTLKTYIQAGLYGLGRLC